MKSLVLAALTISSVAFAEPNTMKFDFQNADITSVVKEYSKASGQKFIIDPNAHGQITIVNKDEITVDEAFNQLSTALAVNGLAISKQGDEMVIQQARAIQRSLIDVSSDLPPLKPTKMATWIVNLKYVSAEEVNMQLRILTSNQGEVFPFSHTNQIIISDFTPNLYRVSELLKRIDVPADKSMTKLAKEGQAYRQSLTKKDSDTPAKTKTK